MSQLKVIARVFENTPQGMFAWLYLPSGKKLVVGIPEWQYNQIGVSSIPYGLSDFHLVRSTKRSEAAGHDVMVYQMYDATPNDGIDDTSGRIAVQWHIGNYCGDVSKGYRSNSEACFMPGMAMGNDGKTGQRMVVRSVEAYDIFMREMGGKDFTLDFDAA